MIWRSVILIVVLAVFAPIRAPGYLWESQVEIEKRYGPPIKTTGYPHRRAYIYAFEGLEIRIRFFNGTSQRESYLRAAEGTAGSNFDVQRLLELNSSGSQWLKQAYEANDHWTIETRNGRAHAYYIGDASKPRLDVYTHASLERDSEDFENRLARTGKEETFEGIAALNQEGETLSVTVHSGGRVIYIPWSDGWRDRGLGKVITPAKIYRITLRDEESIDEDDAWAFVSDRDHKDYSEAVNDSKCYQLARIQDGNHVVFDRSVCEVHHIKMSKIMADVQYGMPIGSPCDKNFPHHRNVVEGGCNVGDTKKAPLYVCPKCVEACESSKR